MKNLNDFFLTDKLLKSRAYINKRRYRVNSDGTTVKERKPNIKLMPNHRVFKNEFAIVFNIGTAIRDKDTGELREMTKGDYGIYRKECNICGNIKPFTKKIHKGENFQDFKLRRKKSNRIRREREKNVY